ncbi:MAG TPA: metallophosphoesterase family protein [Desulfuromonadaceae bacterium]
MPPRRFAIGDVHGCSRTLRRLVEKGIGLTRDDELYLLGDLIDRGPDSRGVLDFILDLRAGGFSVTSVRGNHEEMCLRAGDDLRFLEMWMINGGHATLASFDAEGTEAIPWRYRSLLDSLPYYILLDDFIIVHASLNFDRSDPFGDTEAMLWRRECDVDLVKTGGRRLVSGHTPVTRREMRSSLASARIMVDNGCVFTGRSGLGSLAALELNTLSLTFQPNID